MHTYSPTLDCRERARRTRGVQYERSGSVAKYQLPLGFDMYDNEMDFRLSSHRTFSIEDFSTFSLVVDRRSWMIDVRANFVGGQITAVNILVKR